MNLIETSESMNSESDEIMVRAEKDKNVYQEGKKIILNCTIKDSMRHIFP